MIYDVYFRCEAITFVGATRLSSLAAWFEHCMHWHTTQDISWRLRMNRNWRSWGGCSRNFRHFSFFILADWCQDGQSVENWQTQNARFFNLQPNERCSRILTQWNPRDRHHWTMVFGVGPGNGFRVREAQMANDQIQLMLRVLSRE